MSAPPRILTHPHGALRRKASPVRELTPATRAAIRGMFDAMYEAGGVGLAAPQIGWEVRAIVLNPSGDPTRADLELVLLNPRHLVLYGADVAGVESCLSVPKIEVCITRSARLRVRALGLDGQEHDHALEGMGARIVQHELDHLDGVLILDPRPIVERAT